jgi:hypothetical protein
LCSPARRANISYMLGKSACAPIALLVACTLAACAHNVGQDDHTGEDGKQKGAREIQLDNGEGKAKGIVTYPGGDRVDWKFVQLPEKKQGTLQIELKWVPPRPGLQLAFDVFDEWNTQVAQSKREGKSRKGRQRTATLENAKGKYFIRVYAVGRGDAGTYKMTVDFSETNGPMSIDLAKLDVPDPPKLAAVPTPLGTCDESLGDTFDPKNPACKTVCPKAATPPPGWPPCTGQCPNPPDPSNHACWNKVCPQPATMQASACKLKDFPPCDPNAPDPDNMKCHIKSPPKTGRVIAVNVQGSEVLITIGIGSDAGVGKDWTGQVLQGDSDNPLNGGDLVVVSVRKKETIAKAHLTTDQVNQNPKVKLSPP